MGGDGKGEIVRAGWGPNTEVLRTVVKEGGKLNRAALIFEKRAAGYISLIGNGSNFDDMKRVDAAQTCLISAAELYSGDKDLPNAKRCIAEARSLNKKIIGMLRTEVKLRQKV